MQVFLVAVDSSGNVQPGVSVLQGIITPDTMAPTFTFLNFTSPVIDQNTGLFSMDMTLNTSLPAVVYYAMYRYMPNTMASLQQHLLFVLLLSHTLTQSVMSALGSTLGSNICKLRLEAIVGCQS